MGGKLAPQKFGSLNDASCLFSASAIVGCFAGKTVRVAQARKGTKAMNLAICMLVRRERGLSAVKTLLFVFIPSGDC